MKLLRESREDLDKTLVRSRPPIRKKEILLVELAGKVKAKGLSLLRFTGNVYNWFLQNCLFHTAFAVLPYILMWVTQFKRKLKEFPFSRVHHCVLSVHTEIKSDKQKQNLYREGCLLPGPIRSLCSVTLSFVTNAPLSPGDRNIC